MDANIAEESWPGGPGTVVGLELPTAPAPTFLFALGEHGKRAERVADEAVDRAAQFLDAEPLGIDEHSADQLLLPLALAPASSQFPVARISSHLETNATSIGRFLERAVVLEGQLGKTGVVRID